MNISLPFPWLALTMILASLPAWIFFFIMIQAPFLPKSSLFLTVFILFLSLAAIVGWLLSRQNTRIIIVIIVCGVACGAVALELLLAVLWGPMRNGKGMEAINSPDRTFWYLKPEIKTKSLRQQISVNSWGFRGPEPGTTNPQAIKVLVLGDSLPFCGGVSQEDCFPFLAGTLINADPQRTHPVEIINAAMPGYSLDQIRRFTINRLRDLSYDMVILCFYIDDINRELRYKKSRRFYTPAWPEWIQDLFYSSRSLNSLLTVIGFRDTTFLYTRRLSYEQAWPHVFGTLDDIRKESSRKKATFAVFNIPRFTWKGQLDQRQQYKYIKENDELEAWCQDQGIPYRDALPTLLHRDINSFRNSSSDIHFNKNGHRLMAEEIASFIGNLLPDRRTVGVAQ